MHIMSQRGLVTLKEIWSSHFLAVLISEVLNQLKLIDFTIKKEFSNNLPVIAGGTPQMKVSWQVTGIRQDPLAEKNRVQVVVKKSASEQGFNLHPEAYDMPLEKDLSWNKQLELRKKAAFSQTHDKKKMEKQ